MTHLAWNAPKQERSRRRFEQLLSATEDLILEGGVENLTTNHVAERAGVPIGSLYQFFPNKEALLAALTERYLQGLGDLFPHPLPESLPFANLVEKMLWNIAHVEDHHRAIKPLMASADHPSSAQMQARLREEVAKILAVYFPELSPEQIKLSAAVGVGIVMGLLPLLEQHPPELILPQIRLALVGYLEAVATVTPPP